MGRHLPALFAVTYSREVFDQYHSVIIGHTAVPCKVTPRKLIGRRFKVRVQEPYQYRYNVAVVDFAVAVSVALERQVFPNGVNVCIPGEGICASRVDF